jgi:hypothetical protein
MRDEQERLSSLHAEGGGGEWVQAVAAACCENVHVPLTFVRSNSDSGSRGMYDPS